MACISKAIRDTYYRLIRSAFKSSLNFNAKVSLTARSPATEARPKTIPMATIDGRCWPDLALPGGSHQTPPGEAGTST